VLAYPSRKEGNEASRAPVGRVRKANRAPVGRVRKANRAPVDRVRKANRAPVDRVRKANRAPVERVRKANPRTPAHSEARGANPTRSDQESKLFLPVDGALKLRLVHSRAALDAELLGLVVELVAGAAFLAIRA
jgi:hypothetical protein